MSRTALSHIPSKETQARPSTPGNADGESITHPDADNNTGSESNVTRDGSPSHVDDLVSSEWTTIPDQFGIFRVYSQKPIQDPLESVTLSTICDAPSLVRACDHPDSDGRPGNASNQGPPQDTPYYHPFSNPSAAAMMVAHHSGSPVQSVQQTTELAHILGSLGSDLSATDLTRFDASLENKRLDAFLADAPESTVHREDKWHESSVRIRLPLDKAKIPEMLAAEFEVTGVHYRDIVSVITSVYQSEDVRSFNHIPFEQYWKPSDDALPERLYGEIYCSEAMLAAHREISDLQQAGDPPEVENVIVPLLLYSDSTHLANFGTASSWPIYMFIGSQSKYTRGKPKSFACHHIAYMPSVSGIIDNWHLSHDVSSYQTLYKISIGKSTKSVQQQLR